MPEYTLRKPATAPKGDTRLVRKSYEASIEFVALNTHAERNDSPEAVGRYTTVALLAYQYSVEPAVIVDAIVTLRRKFNIPVG